MESDIIKISHLNKSFSEVKAVNDLSFRVKKGELFADVYKRQEGDWYMDGKKTSGNMYETYYKKYHANATWYSFAQSSNNNLIRKELSNTKQKLGM